MRRTRRSTWLLLVVFLVALVTYVLVRPPPPRAGPAPDRPAAGTTAAPHGPGRPASAP